MKINTFPQQSSILLSKGLDIPVEDIRLWQPFITKMKEVCNSIENCAGLSANQIWMEDGAYPNIFIMAFASEGYNGWKEFINPVVLLSGKTSKNTEGCVSRPGKIFISKRSKNTTISYFDSHGVNHIEKYGGQYSTIIQHEMDHLNGKILKRQWKEYK